MRFRLPLSAGTALTLAALLAPAAAAQAVHTVKTDGSGDFLTLQEAVDAAAPGDIVLVFSGFHPNVTVDRGLTLVSMGGAVIGKALEGPGTEQPALSITGVPAAEHVVLSGFTVFVGGAGAGSAIEVSNSAGAVWVQDCFVDSYGSPALTAEAAATIAISNTSLQTNLIPALPDGTPQPKAGAQIGDATRLYGYDADVAGSHGTFVGPGLPVANAPADGGPGLVVADSLARWAGGTIRGGNGNSLFVDGCLLGGDGGAGVVTLDGPGGGAPDVALAGTTVMGGPGSFVSGCAPPTVAGPAFDVVPGSLVTKPGPARLLMLPGQVAAGGALPIGFSGAAGDTAFLLVATAAAPGFAVGALDLHLQLDTLLTLIPFALPGGSLTVNTAAPPLPPVVDGLTVALQAVFIDGQGAKRASNPRALVIWH